MEILPYRARRHDKSLLLKMIFFFIMAKIQTFTKERFHVSYAIQAGVRKLLPG